MLPVFLFVGFCLLVAKNGATDVTALANGKEAPSLHKFNTRHAEKAKRRDGQWGRDPGPTRRWFRAVRENAAEELIQRADHKSKSRRAWYRETADQRDEQWRIKWQAKLDKRERTIRRWGQRKGVLTIDSETVDQPEGTDMPDPNQGADQPHQNRGNGQGQPRSQDSTQGTGHDRTSDSSSGENNATTENTTSDDTTASQTPDPPAEPMFGSDESAANTTTTAATEGGTVHEQGANALRDSAEEIRRFCQDLAQFADGLSGRGYGNEITGLAAEMRQILGEVPGIYADLAEEIQQQGDEVRNAHDATGHQIPDEAAMA